MKYRRKEGFYAKRSGGYLVLYPFSSFQPTVLHPSSVLLYSLIDGITDKNDIFHIVKESVDPTNIPTDNELESSFQQIIEFGLIEQVYSESSSPEFVTVGFVGFWESFQPNRNYFLEALTTRFVPIIVDPVKEIPSIIFIGDEGDITNYNHLTQENISIGVHTKKEEKPSNSFDLNIYTNAAEGNASDLSIPIWAIHFTWIKHFTNTTPEHHLFELDAFSPKKCGARIYSFLSEYIKENLEINVNNYFLKSEENAARIINFPSIKKGKLTIGMATYDDYDGVFFTLQSIRMYHGEVLDRMEFLIIDNHPGGAISEILENFIKTVPNCRYLSFSEYNGTSIRDLIFRESQTEYVMSVDSHIMIASGGIAKTIRFFDENPDCLDLLQGPILLDDLKEGSYASSFRPEWNEGMFGVWHKDSEAEDPNGNPFEITMHGLGLFACRKTAWLGFNPKLRGFGAEEGYIHEKFRQAGRTTICLPFLKWLHRFGRPNGTLYPNIYEDRIRNYKIAFEEVGWDTAPIDFHFSKVLGKEHYRSVGAQIDQQLKNPLYKMDAVYYLMPPEGKEIFEKAKTKISEAGLEYILRKATYCLSPSGVPEYEEAMRSIVDNALKYGFKTVMVIHDTVVFSDVFYAYLNRILANIETRKWASLHIGSDIRGNYISMFDKSLYLPLVHRPPNSHIAAFNLEHVYALAQQANQNNDPVFFELEEVIVNTP